MRMIMRLMYVDMLKKEVNLYNTLNYYTAMDNEIKAAFAELHAKLDAKFGEVNNALAAIQKDVEHIKNWTYSDQNSDMVIKLEKVTKGAATA